MSDFSNVKAGLKIAIDKEVKNINQQALSRGTRVINELRNAELEVLSGSRSGKVYRKPHSKATYTASAPGEVPARRSGQLRLNWSGSIKGYGNTGGGTMLTVEYASRSPHSGYLEDGTKKMEARPFKDKILTKATPGIMEIYKKPF